MADLGPCIDASHAAADDEVLETVVDHTYYGPPQDEYLYVEYENLDDAGSQSDTRTASESGTSTTSLEPGVIERLTRVRPGPSPGNLMQVGPHDVVEIVLLYTSAKFLGPFLEHFATKLGEKTGEATVEALKRIRGHRSSHRTRLRIDVGGKTTTIQLPSGELSDACKLAILDLDLSAPENQGVTLRWDESIEKFWWSK